MCFLSKDDENLITWLTTGINIRGNVCFKILPHSNQMNDEPKGKTMFRKDKVTHNGNKAHLCTNLIIQSMSQIILQKKSEKCFTYYA